MSGRLFFRTLIVVTGLVALLLPASPAAAHSCSLVSGTLTINYNGNNLTILRSGSSITLSSESGTDNCGATVNNVDRIDLPNSGIVQEDLTIDLSGGQFAPGDTPESTGTSEIEWTVDTGGCSCLAVDDRIHVLGSSGADVVRFAGPSLSFPDGVNGVNLNNDNDMDVTFDNDDVFRTFADGGGGNDEIRGGQAGRLPYPRTLTSDGGSGNDILTGGSGSDGLDGEEGDDTLSGGSGNDVFDESAGTDTADGGTGNDEFRQGFDLGGPTAFTGGTGTDRVDYGSRGEPVSLSVDGVANDGEATEGDNIGDDVETLIAGLGDDFLFGGPGAETLEGRFGSDTILQGEVPDGADVIFGGDGLDTLDYSERTGAVNASLDLIANDGAAGEGDDVSGVETIAGGSGNDHLAGTAGPQTLIGGNGDDSLNGGVGTDHLTGGSGRDTVDYSDRIEGVAVTLDEVNDDGEPGENDQIDADIENARGGSGADQITGDGGANYLFGSGGIDNLIGGGGNDRLIGGEGADDMFGSSGNDRFVQGAARDGADEMVGGLGTDTVDYSARTSTVAVALDGLANDGDDIENDDVGSDIEVAVGGSASDFFKGDASGDRFSGGGGKDDASGAGGADQLTGGGGNDKLRGDSGADKLVGGLGNDLLNGGTGADTCFGGPGSNTLTSC